MIAKAPINDGYGLDAESVARSRARHGENQITRKKTKSFWEKLFENFNDPMIKILLIALCIDVFLMVRGSQWYETIGIAIVILIATVVSTLSEQGSEAAFERLQQEASKIKCRVIRRDGVIEIPVWEVVVGDLISLQPGDKIPADGFIIDGELDVDQSALNGETKEARKRPSYGVRSEPGLLSGDRLFSGSVACSGAGVMRVSAVGEKTFYGKLALEVQEETGDSPLKTRLAGLAKTISVFGYIGAFFVALVYIFNAVAFDMGAERLNALIRNPRALMEIIAHASTLAVTVIVMAVPEGLPMMITVVLSSNMKRMLKDNVLVRKLVGIETTGSLNILFTDKTGTLTRGELETTGFIDGDGGLWPKNGGLYLKNIWKDIYRCVHHNSTASMSLGKAIGGNATDRALLEYVNRHAVARESVSGAETAAFSSQTKFMASRSVGTNRPVTFVKGAPEVVLSGCSTYKDADGVEKPFEHIRKLKKTMSELQKNSARLIAVATAGHTVQTANDLTNLTLIGILSVRDDIRREAAAGVKRLQDAGVQVVIVTGDSIETAESIARNVGVLNESSISITSRQFNAMSDDEAAGVLPRLAVVARALPSDKSRLVQIAGSNGLVCGMTGDGVNDAPALKRADVGFAMGSGTEVAKEAGDIVILDDNLLSIAKAVKYGRTIFKSIRKFIIFQLTLNFCAMGISMIAPLIGVDSPVTVIQMLWINMVMDTLAGLAFGGEQALEEYMREKPKKRDEPIINGYMWREIFGGAIYSLLICLWFLKSKFVSEFFPENSLRLMTAFFALFMFTGIFNSFCARTHHMSLTDHMAGNKPFIFIMGIVTVAQIIILYFGGTVFRTNGLTLPEFLFVGALSATTVAAHLSRKAFYAKRGMEIGT
jgi:calcium-translocating P-type ATPase